MKAYKSLSIVFFSVSLLMTQSCHPWQWEELPRADPDCPTVSNISPTGAAAGEAVTVSGDHFDPANIAQFELTVGGEPVNISEILSDSKLTFTVPEECRGGTVVVARNGCAGNSTSNSAFVYYYSTDKAPKIYAGEPDDHDCDDCLSDPRGLAMDHKGNLFIADFNHEVIQKVEPNGNMKVVAGKKNDPGSKDNSFDGTGARLAGPVDVAVDPVGNVYISDQGNKSIRKMDLGAMHPVSTVANPAGKNFGVPNLKIDVNQPSGIAVGHGDSLYLLDYITTSIFLVDLENELVKTIVDGTASSSCSLSFPTGVHFSHSSAQQSHPILVADFVNGLLKGFQHDATCERLPKGESVSPFSMPYDVVSDQRGNIFISDQGAKKIFIIYQDGVVREVEGFEFDKPTGIALDNSGKFLYVADGSQHVVVQFELE